MTLTKEDKIWGSIIAVFALILIIPFTRGVFESLTASHPFIMGFIKFGVLASMGELLAVRIVTGSYTKPLGFPAKVFVWGMIGVLMAAMFPIFAGGIQLGIKSNLWPSFVSANAFTIAFFTSFMLNFFFGPIFMAMHKMTDCFIDLWATNGKMPTYDMVLTTVDWRGFMDFVVMKTIPFIWLPLHTVTFLLPENYRIIMAAALSIVLGGILAFAKGGKKAEEE